MRSGNIAIFKPILDLVIAATIINELDKKNAMNKQAEYTPLNRQERKTELAYYKELSKELEQEINYLKKRYNNRIDELETVIERHLIGWVMVVVFTIAIGVIQLAIN